jgi:hypothetical protein
MLRYDENGSDGVHYEKYLPGSLTLDGMADRTHKYEDETCSKSVPLNLNLIISTHCRGSME